MERSLPHAPGACVDENRLRGRQPVGAQEETVVHCGVHARDRREIGKPIELDVTRQFPHQVPPNLHLSANGVVRQAHHGMTCGKNTILSVSSCVAGEFETESVAQTRVPDEAVFVDLPVRQHHVSEIERGIGNVDGQNVLVCS